MGLAQKLLFLINNEKNRQKILTKEKIGVKILGVS